MTNILVTGGLGFIGGAVAIGLAAAGNSVRILDPAGETGRRPDLPKDVRVCSVTDRSGLKSALAGMEICIHLAGSPVATNPRADHALSEDIYLRAAEPLFAEAAQAEIPVIFASSAAVYADGGPGLIGEDWDVRPSNAHGVEKHCLETQAGRFARSHGLRAVGLRMFNVYGPGQSFRSPYCGLLRLAIQNILDGRPVVVNGDGGHRRDFVEIRDVVRFITSLVDHPFDGIDMVNLSTGRGVSVNDAIAILGKAAGRDLEIEWRPGAATGVVHSVGDPAKARDKYGFATEIDLEDGVRVMVDSIMPGLPARKHG